MKKHLFISIFAVFLLFSCFELHAAKVMKIEFDGGIGVATAEYIETAIDEATENNYKALLITLDTPGGLLEATRDIVKYIMESDIPVIVYVSPGGARAGSAGVFITMSAHIAAMAEGTNIGAAHPVGLGGGETDSTMNSKITNDAAAFARTIAQKYGRNEDWAEKAVRESISSTENEAFEANAIDVIAPDLDSLFRYADGKLIKVKGMNTVLNLENVEIIKRERNWRENLLGFLSDPNIAYILILIGVFGIIFELKSPGAIFPGVIGGISVLLAAYSLQMMPVNLTGLILMLLGIVLFIIEVFVASYGILTIGGVVSFALGSIMLIDSPFEFMQISIGLVITVTAVLTLFVVFLAYFGLKAQFAKKASGASIFVGETGKAMQEFKAGEKGNIKIHGEIWKAVCDEDVNVNDELVIVSVEKFVLNAKRINK